MKKITLFFLLVFSFVFTSELMAQTLNQNANWPNGAWTLSGTSTFDSANPDVLEGDPTVGPTFAYDDDDQGNGDGTNDNQVAAESPVIDLTAAAGAGETWITVSGDYVYRYLADDALLFEYYDADLMDWVAWGPEFDASTAGAPTNDYCSVAAESYTTEVLNIVGFTANQLANFRYRISYDDNPAGADWNYGFCFQSPTITSATPPACPDPTSLAATPTSPTEATIAWTETGTASSWDVELVDITAAGTATGTPTTSGVANPYMLMGLTAQNDYEIYVRSDCSGSTSNWVGPVAFSTPAVPPANDECDDAVALTVNADLACGVVTSGTTVGGTASPQPDDATGTPDNDVWFTFVATGAQHQISLLNVTAVIGTSTDMGMSVFDDAAGCNMTAANEVGESDPNTLNLTGLTGGNTYYVRVYGWSGTTSAQATFDICVGTPPAPPANDECDAAIALTVNADYECGVVTAGTTVSATESPQPDDATGTPNNDVWFTFVATGDAHRISLLNIVAQVGTSVDMGMSVFDDAAGCNMTAANEVGESDPNTLDLTGLTGGNTYYVRVYGWSSSPTATAQTTFDVCVGTPPTCFVPEGLDAAFVAPSSADLSWTAPTDGATPVGYNWEVVPQGNAQGDGVVSSGSTADLFATATGLTIDTLYDLRVQSDCGGGDTSAWSQPFTFNAGYCVPNGTSTATYIDDFSTSGNDMNISNLGSGLAANNYQNNSATMSVSGGPNATIDFEVVIVGGTVGCAVWVDWNNDLVFDTSEVAFSTTSYGNGPFNGTITIPDATPDGDYRMRVLIDWNDPNPGDDAPCSYGSATTPRGETEDYTLTVDASLSTDDFENENAFTYFPNPVKNTLTLNAQNAIDSIAIINMLGQEVLTASPRELRSELDMSQLQTGTYFVKVTINEVTETVRIIKQ